MILEILFDFFNTITKAILGLLPNVTLASLPIIGETLQDKLVDVILVWNAFMVTFPYAETVWNVLLYVIIPFEVSVIALKFLLGNRSPVNIN